MRNVERKQRGVWLLGSKKKKKDLFLSNKVSENPNPDLVSLPEFTLLVQREESAG